MSKPMLCQLKSGPQAMSEHYGEKADKSSQWQALLAVSHLSELGVMWERKGSDGIKLWAKHKVQ